MEGDGKSGSLADLLAGADAERVLSAPAGGRRVLRDARQPEGLALAR